MPSHNPHSVALSPSACYYHRTILNQMDSGGQERQSLTSSWISDRGMWFSENQPPPMETGLVWSHMRLASQPRLKTDLLLILLAIQLKNSCNLQPTNFWVKELCNVIYTHSFLRRRPHIHFTKSKLLEIGVWWSHTPLIPGEIESNNGFTRLHCKEWKMKSSEQLANSNITRATGFLVILHRCLWEKAVRIAINEMKSIGKIYSIQVCGAAQCKGLLCTLCVMDTIDTQWIVQSKPA